METLLDYQWDRPEIASPTKPAVRRSGRRLLDAESEAAEAEAALGAFGNAVFLLAPCPHSQRELLQFAGGGEGAPASRAPAATTPKQLREKLLPKRLQEVLSARKIALYWVDSTDRSKLWESPDHLGYWTVCELLYHVGGTILPSETFSQHCIKAGETLLGGDKKLSREPHFSSWISIMPTDSTLNCLLNNSLEYEASFPRMEGTLFLPVEGKELEETWPVTLEPLTMHQRHFQKPVRIFLKGTVTQWSLPMSDTLGTDSWMLQSPDERKSTQRTLFQQLADRLTAEELHLVASVDPGEGWPPISGVISPLSTNTTILTLFHTERAEFQRHFLQTVVAEDPQETASLPFDVKDIVLNQIDSLRKDTTNSDPASPLVPEWAQQELDRTGPWSPAVLERWFLRSALSGASSDLMESFWLLQAALSHKEEPSKAESELTRCLSELYLRKSREESAVSNQEDGKKKRGVPRTPVRQKMNTMCRSLKMLNVARLNVKAQKLHPDGSPDATGEKGTQKTAAGRAADRLESRGRSLRSSKPKDFKTEEQLLSYIHENYEKTVATGETVLYSCAQNMISAIKAFLKAKGTQELEVNCLNQVKNNLLKTSKSLRQNIGKKLDKEEKVRECQLQVFLRLELCLQCPSVLESVCDMEQVVEEVTDLLRMVCLTEDSAYLANFLEEILGLYVDSIPKTLASLYHSLGFVVPQQLVGVLPTDCFSDDSMTQESKSPPLSEPPTSNARRSVSAGTESDQLEELRTRSAKKRRKNALIRHKIIAEISQNLRQIEIPKATKRATKNENSRPTLQQPPLPGKDTVQEVTKVRRNLFNHEISPSKRLVKRGLPRSHSVSAVEGLEGRLASAAKTRGHPRLLTKSVPETPEHKQISRRLLHRQIKGRSSDPGPDIDVVDESPEKGDEQSLRRSPRIKQLSLGRTKSGSFYSTSQPKSRSVQRVHSFQQDHSDQGATSSVHSIRSPKSLLFGAASEKISPSEKSSGRIKRPSGSTVDSETPTTSQAPQKRDGESPRSSGKKLRRLHPAPQTLPCSSPAAAAPGKRVPSQSSRDPFWPAWDSPPPDLTLQKPHALPEGGSSLLGPLPSSPRRPGGPPHGSVQDSGPESSSSPAVPAPSAAQTWSECPAPAGHCLRWSPRAAGRGGCGAAASARTPQGQEHRHPRVPAAAQGGPAQPRKDQVLPAADGPRDPTVTPCPPASPKEPCNSPVCGVSKSPLGEAATEPSPPGPVPSPSRTATQRSFPAPSAATAASQTPVPATRPPPPPSHSGTRLRTAGNPEGGPLDGQSPGSAGNGDAGGDQREAAPGAGLGCGRHSAPALPDAEGRVSPAGGGPGPEVRGAAQGPSPTAPGSSLSPPASGLPLLPRSKVDTSPWPEPEPPGGDGGDRPDPGTPPCCLRPAHGARGPAGGQTYICRRCAPGPGPPSSPSRSHPDGGAPRTPSPKRGGRTPPDSLRGWPRRKRAAGLPRPRGEGPGLGQTPGPGDAELEGVGPEPAEDTEPPAGRGGAAAPRGHDAGASPGSGSTSPPGRAGWSLLSAGGLQALTQSPLLFGGPASCPRRRDPADEDVDASPRTADDSPFSQSSSRRRPISRTYARKKLLSS